MLNEYLAKDGAYVRYSIHESTLFSCNFILCYSITVNRIQAYDLLQNLFFFNERVISALNQCNKFYSLHEEMQKLAIRHSVDVLGAALEIVIDLNEPL